MRRPIAIFISLLWLAGLPATIAAQTRVDTTMAAPSLHADSASIADTIAHDLVSRFKKLASAEAVASVRKYDAERIVSRQRTLINAVRKETRRAQLYLRHGLDSLHVIHELADERVALDVAKDGIITNAGSIQTQRNLTVSASILAHLLSDMGQRKARVDDYAAQLTTFRNNIDSLYTDSLLYVFPMDSITIVHYVKRVAVVAKEISPVDSALDRSLSSMEGLQLQVDQAEYELRSLFEEYEQERRLVAESALHREVSSLLYPPKASRPLREIFYFSMAKEKLALLYYLGDNVWKLLTLLILIVISNLFIRSIRNRLRTEGLLDQQLDRQLVVKHPLKSAIVIVCCTFQFCFFDAPFIFSFSMWLIAAICLTGIFRGYIVRYWMRFWIVVLVLFTVACTDNLILQASRAERWFILMIALAGVAFCITRLLGGRLHTLREQRIVYAMGFLVITEAIAAGLNAYGCYNLGKTLMVTGYAGVIIGILFLWTVRLLNEGLQLAQLIYRHPERQLLYLNFNRIGTRVPWAFYLLLIIGWVVLLGRNFYEYRQLVAPFNDFLTEERTLGDYTFTVNGLFVFLLIALCSMILSRLISYFAYDPSTLLNKSKENQATRLTAGSWILLVRIFVISAGLFLAVAAAGIPLDKLTIILGALSVGIGLGLQSLVSNLVSGLVIAFEKPVNVGDYIDIDGKLGTMKSIGFRSSVVTLSDGACMVIPNGDLLNHRLVNWTMGRNVRRISLPVGVAYGTDLKLVHRVLSKVLEDNQRIQATPAAMVVARGFGGSSIDFELVFWVGHFREAASVSSEVIAAIQVAFKDAGIDIPFPQMDIHLPGKAEPGDIQ